MEGKNFNVRELTFDEKVNINGGSKVGDFFAAVWEGIKDAAEWIAEKFIEWYYRVSYRAFEENNFPLP